MRSSLRSKGMDKDKLVKQTHDPTADLFIQEFPTLKDTEYLILKEQNDLAITRSFAHPSKEGWVLVFEKLPEGYYSDWAES